MKHLLFISLISFYSLHIYAQTIDQLQLETKIDTIFKSFNNPNSPGVAVTVIQNGNVITKKHFGMANLEHSIPFTHESPVRLVYSMGREFLCVGLALMEEEGLLRFDDKVRSYLPKLPEWSKDVTLQDLLNHSSGFDDEWSLLLLMTADMRSQIEKEQVLTLLYSQPKPQVEPGKGYMYNNTDIALLRMVMEMASKQNLPDYLKENLFDPLGMSSTFMNDDIEEIIPGFAENYYGFNPLKKARFIKSSPGGNYRMVTTADDLEKWVKAIDDTTSVVAKGFARLYKDARAIPVVAPNRHYVFGHEWRTVNDTEVIYHGGVGDSFYLIRIPSQQIAVIGLGNGGNFIYSTMQFAHSLLPSVPDSKESSRFFPDAQVSLNVEESTTYTGRYFAQEVGYNSHIPSIQFYDLKIEGDQLNFYSGSSGEGFPITSFGNGYFKDMDDDTRMHFTKSRPDSAMTLEIWQEGMGYPLIFHREENKVTFTKNYLQQYTGKFYSPHLDYYFRIVLNEEGHLILKRPTVPDTYMEPTSEDRFLLEQKNGGYSTYIRAIFSKNNTGKVDGFNVRYSRLMHHRFDKVND